MEERVSEIFIRDSDNPLLEPGGHLFGSLKVYNPALIHNGDGWHMFYRAVGDDWISSLGYAHSDDGTRFKAESAARVVGPRPGVSIEDPRISLVDGVYFMTYTEYDGESVLLSVASSLDLCSWELHGPALFGWDMFRAGGQLTLSDPVQERALRSGNGERWSKAGGIFPARLSGEYLMLFGDTRIWMARSGDGVSWVADEQPFFWAEKWRVL